MFHTTQMLTILHVDTASPRRLGITTKNTLYTER